MYVHICVYTCVIMLRLLCFQHFFFSNICKVNVSTIFIFKLYYNFYNINLGIKKHILHFLVYEFLSIKREFLYLLQFIFLNCDLEFFTCDSKYF
jgi:hypothetical protein